MRTSENRTTEIRRSQGPGVFWLLSFLQELIDATYGCPQML